MFDLDVIHSMLTKKFEIYKFLLADKDLSSIEKLSQISMEFIEETHTCIDEISKNKALLSVLQADKKKSEQQSIICATYIELLTEQANLYCALPWQEFFDQMQGLEDIVHGVATIVQAPEFKKILNGLSDIVNSTHTVQKIYRDWLLSNEQGDSSSFLSIDTEVTIQGNFFAAIPSFAQRFHDYSDDETLTSNVVTATAQIHRVLLLTSQKVPDMQAKAIHVASPTQVEERDFENEVRRYYALHCEDQQQIAVQNMEIASLQSQIAQLQQEKQVLQEENRQLQAQLQAQPVQAQPVRQNVLTDKQIYGIIGLCANLLSEKQGFVGGFFAKRKQSKHDVLSALLNKCKTTQSLADALTEVQTEMPRQYTDALKGRHSRTRVILQDLAASAAAAPSSTTNGF